MSYTSTRSGFRTSQTSNSTPFKLSQAEAASAYSSSSLAGITQSSPLCISDDEDDDDNFDHHGMCGPSTFSKKRKRETVKTSSGYDAEYAETLANELLAREGSDAKTAKRAKKSKSSSQKDAAEKRLRPFRLHPPQSYLDRLGRAVSQRMFLIDRERKMSEDGTHEEEVFDIAGTTGNIYQVTITKRPRCTCPDQKRNGKECKHIIYVLVNVLKAPENLSYQLAFLSTELAEIFANSPASPQSSDGSAADTSRAGKQKPIEGDCPVCVMEFEAGEDIVWCKAACGNNVHKACFQQWAKSKPGEVKCVYCRTPWKGDEEMVKTISKNGRKNADGYVNVASELGLSGQRDYSTYHGPWARSRGYGRYGGYTGYDYGGDDYAEDEGW